ncbi:MAG: DUF3108 domain-containing protein [Akkermansiaceae bacterium]|jgi:hypothetical protein|nr:DUF3108 domain-containing protein [Akkermansiaceae bacterium]MDP4647780.1 DUF3108 domain-containing protein [Akkermansiaceae bacterium]MDP4719608.1 DUF3108 domain-containing protein [Akkermansiaceae bacterium]MDP4780855.1 DUF3108 domain-containing protein [Akkermansiaceae bacterium]MDP4848429.1 DUF3108 domain-containing protein [Akkermansiaceae bacterium]
MKFPTIAIFALSATAALSAPAWTTQLTSGKAGSHSEMPSCTLDFTMSWKGMVQAGTCRLEFAPPGVSKPGAMVIKSTATSQGAANALFPYKHSFWSEVTDSTLQTRYFKASDEDGKETCVTTNRYSPGSVSVHELATDSKTGAVQTQAFTFPHTSRDIFSAILFIRSQKLDVGEEHTTLLLPFTSPYLLKVRCEAKEQHMGKDALRLSFALTKIDKDTGELKVYKKLKKPVTLWLSDDTDRVPLEIRAAVYIGDVRAVLTNFKKNP